MSPLSRDEWSRRFAARVSERTGWSNEEAEGLVLRVDGAARDSSPEYAADEEINSWCDNEGAID